MAIILEAVAANGTVQHVPLDAATTTIEAQPGLRYRLFNDAGGRVAPAALVKRVDGSLLVEGLPGDRVLELDGFFTRCTPQDACSLSMDNIGGAAEETVTPATAPVAALPDGGFLMYASGMTAASAAPPRESEFSFKPVLGVLGGLAIVGGAGGGGGGGGGGSSDTTPPDAPVITSGAYSNRAKPVFTGTAEPGSTVTMTLDVGSDGISDVTYSTTVASNRAWTIDTATATPTVGALPTIAEGVPTSIVARASDAAGNFSAETRATVTLDLKPPEAPTITSALLTNDTTPTIRGSAEAGTIVTVRLDLDRNGTYDVAWTTIASNAGAYSVDLGAAPASGTLPGGALGAPTSTARLSVFASDLAGNASDEITAVLEVDTRIPDPPVIDTIGGDNALNAAEAAAGVTITGTLAEAGRPVTVRWGDVALDATVTGNDWTVTFAPAQIPVDGTQTVRATFVGATGSTSEAGTRDVLIDRVAPGAPTITAIPEAAGGGISGAEAADGTTVTVSLAGTLAVAGDAIRIQWGSQLVADYTITGTDIGGATATITVAAGVITAQGDGSFNVTATIVDVAGNVGAPSAGFPVVVDASAPTQAVTVTAVTDNVAPVTGTVANGGTTNDTTPELAGSLSGALGAGETLQVLRNGTVIGTATVTGTTWSYADSGLTNGTTYAYTARVADAAGNQGTASSAYSITVDTVAPAQTVTITAVTDDVVPVTGTVASGGTTNDAAPLVAGTLSGALAANETLQVLRNGTVIGTATVTGTTWSYADSGLANGTTYAYTARVADAAGNQGTASSGYSITVLTAAPTKTAAVTAVADDVAPVTGTVASGGTTNDTAPVISGTLSAALGAGESVEVLRGGSVIGTASVTGTTWSYADSGLANGTTYAYTAHVVNIAGSEGPTGTAYTITVDTAAPAQTVAITAVTDNVAPITGTVANGGTTDDTTPALAGSLSSALGAGETLQVLRNGTTIGTASVTGTNWTYADSGLADDTTYAYTARVVDAAGNQGTASAAYTITIDASAPAQTVTITAVTDNAAPVTGTVANGGFTNDTTPALAGSLPSALGAGETLQVLRNGTVIGTASVAGTNWSYADSGLANGNTYAYTARVVDGVGNQGPLSGSYTITVDTAAPAQTVTITAVTDNVAPITGTVANGGTTNDSAPQVAGTLSGALAANETLQVLRNGTVIGTASVTGTNWSYADSGLANGTTYAYTARVADAAGNQGTASSGYSITIDTAAPATPTIDAVAGDNVVNSDEATAGVTVSGIAEAGSSVTVTWGSITKIVTAGGGGAWSTSFTSGQLPADGASTISATATDASGNTGSAGTRSVAIDRSIPTVTISDVLDNVAPVTGSVPNGGTTDDNSPTLVLTFSEVFGAGATVEVFRNGSSVGSAIPSSSTTANFTDATAPADGDYAYTARMTDAAGNVGVPSGAYLVTIDTTP